MTADRDRQQGPLTGLRVIDLSTTPAGAHASQLLADFGAEVVLVERPGGSALRELPSFPFLGRGKKSIVLDLADDDDLTTARSLALGADVLIETFRPGVTERLGLAYDELAAENAGLVYGSVSAWGRSGPYADAKGYEELVLARSGACHTSGAMADRPGPAHVSVPFATFGAAQILAQGIFAALHERERSGRGQRVDSTLIQGLASMGPWNWYVRVITEKFPDAFTAQPPFNEKGLPTSPMFFMLLNGLTKDGRWLQFSQVAPHLWLALVKSLDLSWVYGEEKWKTAPQIDDEDARLEFWKLMIERVRTKTVAEWQEVFEADHDVWGETLRRGSELLDHDQMQHLGAVVEIDDPEFGPVRQPGPIVQLRETPAVLHPAPRLDEHGEVLRSDPWPERDADADAGNDDTHGADFDLPALDGVTVIELGTFFAAPYAGTLLAELGARVIKVESLQGEPMRSLLPFPEVGAAKVMQGKESIALDLGTDEGQAVVHELVTGADIVLQSFRAGVADRQGVGEAALRGLNPDLIYLNAPGYGIDGPCGDRPAYAPTIGAGSGLVMRNIGPSIAERPDLTVAEIRASQIRLSGAGTAEYGQADGISALTVASVLSMALYIRDRTGVAQGGLTTMLTSTAHALGDQMVEYAGKPDLPTADEDLYGYSATCRLYETADGWVYLTVITDAEWATLVDALEGLVDLSDGRFAAASSRRANDGALAEILGAAFRTRDAETWEKLLLARDVGCVKVFTGPPEAALQSEELGRASGLVADVEHPTFGQHPRLAPLVRMSRSASVVGPGVLLGQHTDDILGQLGRDEAAIADLRDRNIVT